MVYIQNQILKINLDQIMDSTLEDFLKLLLQLTINFMLLLMIVLNFIFKQHNYQLLEQQLQLLEILGILIEIIGMNIYLIQHKQLDLFLILYN